VDGSLVGDVDYESLRAVAGALTPVPGGLGPLTPLMLIRHTLLGPD
jgi:methylenetetrahydrofolate dehydrogenase (NADP+)/methenyltetrahydrofolate cyclohydrolase